MSTKRTQLMAILERTPSALVDLTSSLSEAALDFRPEANDWSIREILAHLVDDEMFVMRTRVERMVKEEQPTLAAHDEKKWYHQRNTSRDALALLLEDFELQRAASLGMLRLFRDDEWLRTGYQPEYGHFTIEEWMGKWVEHDVVHLQQIEQNSSAYRKTGAH